MLLRLAWRNLWRNGRRTALTVAAATFAVALTLASLAVAHGQHSHWIDQVVRAYPGHVEVSLAGYRDNRTLDYSMILDPVRAAALDHVSNIRGWAPRLESWALAIPDTEASVGRAAWLVGVDPARESALSSLAGTVKQGRFLNGGDEFEVVLGEFLAENLGASPGDQVILLSTDYYGSQAADRFRVVGTISVGQADFDGYAAILRLDQLQAFVEYEGLSHVAFFADEGDRSAGIRDEVEGIFGNDEFEVVAWQQLVPDVVQLVLIDDISAWFMLVLLLIVIGFGLFNTVLMSVFERVREFGMMRAVGVSPGRIFRLVMLESLLLSAIGVVIGAALALPGIAYMRNHPILITDPDFTALMRAFEIDPVIPFDLKTIHLLGTPIAILGIAGVAALLPALRASRGQPVDALREN